MNLFACPPVDLFACLLVDSSGQVCYTVIKIL